jgi:hypothetical protein
MLKIYALLAVLFLSPLMLLAQDVEKGSYKKADIEKPSRDFVMFQLTYEGWMKPDSIHTKGFGRGANIYLCYDFPIKKSNFSFAAGIGIGTSNIYLSDQQIVDTGNLVSVINESKDYKKYKLTTAYLEAPFELRFFGDKENRNRGFKAAVGLRIGTLLGAHTKGKISGTKNVEKFSTKSNFESWRFAGTLRLGWGNFSVMGTYNLNNLLKKSQGPEITPYSIGICLTGL